MNEQVILTSLIPKIKKIRVIKGFSQDYMATKLEITQNTYSKIERGETMLSLEKLTSILAALEVDMNILINFDENMVFNHCNQNDIVNKNHPFTANSIEKIQELYERIITQKDAEIERLNSLLNSKIFLSNK